MFTTPTSVPSIGPVAGVSGVQSAADPAPTPAPSSQTSSTAAGSESGSAPLSLPAASPLKLVVAKAESSLAFTYTLVDQVTGRVVAEIPHEAAKDAAARPDYTAGGVVDTVA